MTITKCRNKVCFKSLQNSVLTPMTDTASLLGFSYAGAVKMPDEVPVGCNSPLFKCHYRNDFKSGLCCAVI